MTRIEARSDELVFEIGGSRQESRTVSACF